jgi:hypothetical protein
MRDCWDVERCEGNINFCRVAVEIAGALFSTTKLKSAPSGRPLREDWKRVIS